MSENYQGFGVSPVDESRQIITGRKYGGTAIMWKKSLNEHIEPLQLEDDIDWMTGIYLNAENRKLLILNVYMPYERPNFECVYLDYLAKVYAVVQNAETPSVFITGDFNADISKRSLFGPLLKQFVSDINFILLDEQFLPEDSFTFVSSAWGTTSWLDHFLCSQDAFDCVKGINILDDAVGSDHKPLICEVEYNMLPKILSETTTPRKNVNWKNVTQEQINRYQSYCMDFSTTVDSPHTTVACNNLVCKDYEHMKNIDILYDEIVSVMTKASASVLKKQCTISPGIPGWNDIVREFHDAARDAYKLWLAVGKPRVGLIFNEMKKARAAFKYSLRRCRAQRDQVKADAIASDFLAENTYRSFWKNIAKVNSAKIPAAENISGISGVENITQMWKEHYNSLFNSVPSVLDDDNDQEVAETTIEEIDTSEIQSIINKLSSNKSCGLDGLSAEHLKYAGPNVIGLLTMLINCIIKHGYIPKKMIDTVLVPVIKDRSGKISSKDNYRPIALCNIASKELEIVLLERMELYLYTHYNQFGFKKGHNTDMAIFALKEILNFYKK